MLYRTGMGKKHLLRTKSLKAFKLSLTINSPMNKINIIFTSGTRVLHSIGFSHFHEAFVPTAPISKESLRHKSRKCSKLVVVHLLELLLESCSFKSFPSFHCLMMRSVNLAQALRFSDALLPL